MRVLIVRNNSNPQAIDASLLLTAYLSSLGIESVMTEASLLETLGKRQAFVHQAGNDFDLAIALGGDGTILRTAHVVAGMQTPILGINFGNLGFLANPCTDGVIAVVSAALAGDVVEERRCNLWIGVQCEDDALLPEAQRDLYDDTDDMFYEGSNLRDYPHQFFALNELAINRGASGHIVTMDVSVAGEHVVNLRGDGLVIATATGSTAYALSAGGPLVAPLHQGLVVVPIAPHTLRSRALVTAPADIVEVTLPDDGSYRETTLFADGELLDLPTPVHSVLVRKGDAYTTLLRVGNQGFYEHASEVFFE